MGHKLKLSQFPTNIEIIGVGKIKSNLDTKCNVRINSRIGGYKIALNCFVIQNICNKLPNQPVKISNLNIPNHIKLADPEFNKPENIDLLLGAHVFWQIINHGNYKLGKSKPVLQNTKFGYIVSGSVPQATEQTYCNFSQLNNQLIKFWEIEECQTRPLLSEEEIACEKHFTSNTKRDPSGRFIVTLPLKESVSKLGDSKNKAIKQFYSLERKLASNSVLKDQYIKFMEEYKNLGHIYEAKSESEISYFLPHHGVLRESSETTKLRVVFNGSSPTTSGLSLNDLQMVGPTIQNDLISILIRFRQYTYVTSADVAMMYRQVLVEPAQRCLQKIVWRSDPSEPLVEYELATVTYGTASAPFLAIRSLYQLGIENEERYPEASQIIKNDFYVDDMVTGSDNLESLISNCNLIPNILKGGGFKLRKWISNSSCVLENVANRNEYTENYNFGETSETKILGIFWSSQRDKLGFDINVDFNCKVTKRTILSTIAKIYDPLGLLGICIIIAKIILQKLWLEKLAWDEQVLLYIHKKWLDFLEGMTTFKNLRIPRHVMCAKQVSFELHIFCDASMEAYGACVYVRSSNLEELVVSKLLCAKSRVAPLKPLSIPRLELCAAVLGSRLAKNVIAALNINNTRTVSCTFWSDSTVVLGWIKTAPNLSFVTA